MALTISEKNNTIRLDIYAFLAFYINIDMLEDLFSSVYILVLKREAPYVFNIFLSVMSLVILAFIIVRKRYLNKHFIFILFSGIILYVVSIILTPDITEIIDTSIIRGILYVLIPIYLFTLIDDIDKLFDAIIPYVFIGLIYTVIQVPIKGLSFVKEEHYMDITYNSLMALLIALGIFLFNCDVGENNKKKLWYLLIFLVVFSINFVIGGRAVILCVSVAILIWLYFAKATRKIIYMLIVIIVAGVLAFNYDTLISLLADLFPQSRTITRILNKNFVNTTTSARMRFWTYIIAKLKNNPLVIRGFLSDRIYLARFFSVDSEAVYGTYTHNIILEILFQFGIVSIPFMSVGIVRIIKAINNVKNRMSNKSKIICFMVIAYAVGQLSVSSSYLIAKSFGMLVGFVLLVNEISGRKVYENLNY